MSSGLTLPHEEQESIQLMRIIQQNKTVNLKEKLLKEIEKLDEQNRKRLSNILEEAIPYRHVKLSPITPLIINNINGNSNLIGLKPIYDALVDENVSKSIKDGLSKGRADKILASDFLGAFGGFFDQRYREHDFLIGRICGIVWLHENFSSMVISPKRIKDFVNQIKGVDGEAKIILDEDPTPSSLKLSQKIRIGRIAVRALRILVIQAKIKGLAWQLLLQPLRYFAILIFRIVEGILTLLMGFLEKLGF